jgi:hypothetical protein
VTSPDLLAATITAALAPASVADLMRAHRPGPGIDDDDDEEDERPIGDPDDDDEGYDDDEEDEDDDEEPLQVSG